MKAMLIALVLMVVIAVGADMALDTLDFSIEDRTTAEASVRL